MFPSLLPTYNRADVAFVRGEGPYLFAEGGERPQGFEIVRDRCARNRNVQVFSAVGEAKAFILESRESQAIMPRQFFGMARRGVLRQVIGTCPQPEVTEIESFRD